MKPLAKILLPEDFSERSLGAARYARTLVERFHSELTLLHVLAPPHYEFGALEVGGTMLTELYENRGAQVADELQTFLAEELRGITGRARGAGRRSGTADCGLRVPAECGSDRHADAWVRPLPAIHFGIDHR